ncbi:hypothetical protein KY285_025124 [Solanum tuberosum]|nr:hypothetical protein KY289_025365 [Solanum tuberosum]KAH0674245.1 hypothetical protein KY284_025332 [Solanum tuberosum]KAH0677323.1 hypothetical protein KY285_025124 [Solanum tuberosum]
MSISHSATITAALYMHATLAIKAYQPLSNFVSLDLTIQFLYSSVRSGRAKIVKRATRARGSELPIAILKRKKATNYWLWAAALAILVLLVIGYMYLQK